jgi:hypothetical protein
MTPAPSPLLQSSCMLSNESRASAKQGDMWAAGRSARCQKEKHAREAVAPDVDALIRVTQSACEDGSLSEVILDSPHRMYIAPVPAPSRPLTVVHGMCGCVPALLPGYLKSRPGGTPMSERGEASELRVSSELQEAFVCLSRSFWWCSSYTVARTAAQSLSMAPLHACLCAVQQRL